LGVLFPSIIGAEAGSSLPSHILVNCTPFGLCNTSSSKCRLSEAPLHDIGGRLLNKVRFKSLYPTSPSTSDSDRRRSHVNMNVANEGNAARTSPIERIPNETLAHIISFIPMDEFVEYCTEDGSERTIHQIIALLHVSRRFRQTMFQRDDLWHDMKFTFSSLAVPTQDFYGDWVRDRDAPLCKALLGDTDFLDCIKEKKEWMFESMEVLSTIVDHVPSFKQSATTVVLRFDKIRDAFQRLDSCEKVTFLRVQSGWSLWDLSAVERYLPQLRILKVALHYGAFEGSFKRLANLESLAINGVDMNGNPLDLSILPFASATTLAELTFVCCAFFPDATLEDFTHLYHLHFITPAGLPYDMDTVDLLDTVPSKLDCLTSSVRLYDGAWHPNDNDIGDMEILDGFSDLLDCACLTHLTALRLGMVSHGLRSDHPIPNPGRYVDRCTVVVEKMVQNMQFLEDVEMWGGLDLDEVHLLTQLPKLKRLKWHLSYYRYLKETNGAYTRGNCDFVLEFIRDTFRGMGKEVNVSIESEWAIVERIELRGQSSDEDSEES
jgi:hypothetical protein